MVQLIKTCAIGDIALGSAKVVEVQGQQIALFNVAGTLHAIDDRCLHRGGSLGQGRLEGSVVTCPLHGWKFDVISGACITRPGMQTKSYAVSIEGHDVLLALVSEAVKQPEGHEAARYLVRFGTMGYVGWFGARERGEYGHREQVVVRTSRGVEAGEIMSVGEATQGADEGPPLGELLRKLTREDKLQQQALLEGEARAFNACRQLLSERQIAAELIDTEQLLDGETIFFYFLGEPPAEMPDLVQELAKHYDARIEFRQFEAGLEAGCGPGCGTEEAPGCTSCDDGGCGTDATCAVAPLRRQSQTGQAH